MGVVPSTGQPRFRQSGRLALTHFAFAPVVGQDAHDPVFLGKFLLLQLSAFHFLQVAEVFKTLKLVYPGFQTLVLFVSTFQIRVSRCQALYELFVLCFHPSLPVLFCFVSYLSIPRPAPYLAGPDPADHAAATRFLLGLAPVGPM